MRLVMDLGSNVAEPYLVLRDKRLVIQFHVDGVILVTEALSFEAKRQQSDGLYQTSPKAILHSLPWPDPSN